MAKHTEVPLASRGRGLGYRPLRGALNEVRRPNLKVLRAIQSSRICSDSTYAAACCGRAASDRLARDVHVAC